MRLVVDVLGNRDPKRDRSLCIQLGCNVRCPEEGAQRINACSDLLGRQHPNFPHQQCTVVLYGHRARRAAVPRLQWVRPQAELRSLCRRVVRTVVDPRARASVETPVDVDERPVNVSNDGVIILNAYLSARRPIKCLCASVCVFGVLLAHPNSLNKLR